MYVFLFILGSLLVIAVAAGIIGGIVAVFMCYDDRRWGLMALAVIVGLVLIVVCAFGAVKAFVAGSRNLNELSCANFADDTGYDTRVITTNAFDGGTCYVDFGGNWVPKGQLWAEMRTESS